MERTLRNRMLTASAATVMLFSGAPDLRAEDTGPGDTVSSRYPFVAGGALTYARLAELPDGTIARIGDYELTQTDLELAVEQAPHFAREGLKRDPLPIVEQHVAQHVLVALAREDASDEGGRMPQDERELLRRTIDKIAGDVDPSLADLRAFYDENREAIGGLPFEQVKEYVARIVQDRLQRERIDEFVRDLGLRRRIEVSSAWLSEHAAAALDNPVDRLRGKGKPVLAVFSAASCCGTDRMKPVLEQVEAAMGRDAEIVYVEAQSNQALAIRHRVTGIPTSLLFDAAGTECYRHQGAVSADGLLAVLNSVLPGGPAQE